MKFFRATLINIGSQILSILMAFGINVVISRTLGPDGKGIYALLVLSSALIVLAANLGLGQAAIFHVGRKTYAFNIIANNLLSMALLIGIPVAALISLILYCYGNPFFNEVPSNLLLTMVIITPLSIAKLYVSHLFMALKDFLWYNGLNLLDLSSRLILLSIFLALGMGLSGTVLAIVISTALSTIVGYYRIYQKTGILHLGIHKELIKSFISYGSRSYSTVLISYLNLRFDQLLVGWFLNVRQLGVYSIAVAVAELAMKFANATTTVLFTRVSSLDGKAATQLTGRITRVTVIIGILTTSLLLFYGSFIIRILFGTQFQDATPVLWMLLPGTFMFNLLQILYSDLSGRGRPEIGIYAVFLSLIFTLTGNFLLIPLWGIMGAALVSSTAYIIGCLVILWGYLHVSGQTLRQLLYITREDFSALWQILWKSHKMHQL